MAIPLQAASHASKDSWCRPAVYDRSLQQVKVIMQDLRMMRMQGTCHGCNNLGPADRGEAGPEHLLLSDRPHPLDCVCHHLEADVFSCIELQHVVPVVCQLILARSETHRGASQHTERLTFSITIQPEHEVVAALGLCLQVSTHMRLQSNCVDCIETHRQWACLMPK